LENRLLKSKVICQQDKKCIRHSLRLVFEKMQSTHWSRVVNLITIAGRMNCSLSLAGRKFNWFYPKIIPLSTMRKSDLFWITIWVPAYDAASFWRDIVL